MFRLLNRYLSRSVKLINQPKSSIDKYFPDTPKPRIKEWEKRGIDKDEFFKRKYSFMKDDHKQLLHKKIEREKRYKQLKSSPKSTNDHLVSPDRPPLNKSSYFEYVYGTHAVLSALKSQKRYLYNRLLVYNPKDKIEEIYGLAKKFGIKIDHRTSKNDLNILTDNAVHNGIVLETRKLMIPQLVNLGSVNEQTNSYELTIAEDYRHSTIEKSVVRSTNQGFPFALYLDEITDPQNVGAIIRSAYYLGVDFIITPDHTTARLGPATAKTSAGALDLMNIYQVSNSLKFLRNVNDNTPWRIVSTDVNPGNKFIEVNQLSNLLHESPILLVLGSEGQGVRTNVKSISDFIVKIDKNRHDDNNIVDSMNVNAATSVLLSKFLL